MSRLFLVRQLPLANGSAGLRPQQIAVRTLASKTSRPPRKPAAEGAGKTENVKASDPVIETVVASRPARPAGFSTSFGGKQGGSAFSGSGASRPSSSSWMSALRTAVIQDSSPSAKEQAKVQLIEYFKALPGNELQKYATKDLMRSLVAITYLPPPQGSSSTWQPVVDALLKEIVSRSDLTKVSGEDAFYGKSFRKVTKLGKRWASPSVWEAVCARVVKDVEADSKLVNPHMVATMNRTGDKQFKELMMKENFVEALMANKAQWDSLSVEDTVELFYVYAMAVPQTLNKQMAEMMEIATKKLSQPNVDQAISTRSYLKLRHAKTLRDYKFVGWADNSLLDNLRGRISLKLDPARFTDYDCHMATAVIASGGRKFLQLGKEGKLQESDSKFIRDLCGEFEKRESLLNKPLKLLVTNLSNFTFINRNYGVPETAFLVRFADKLIDSATAAFPGIKEDPALVEQVLSELARVASTYPDTLPKTEKFIDAVVFPACGIVADSPDPRFDDKISTDRAIRIANFVLYSSKPAQRDLLFHALIASLNTRNDLGALSLKGHLFLARTMAFAGEKLANKHPEYPRVKAKIFDAFAQSFPTNATYNDKTDSGMMVRTARAFSQLSDASKPLKIIGDYVVANLSAFSSLELAQLSTETLPPSSEIITRELTSRGFSSGGSFEDKARLAWSVASSVTSNVKLNAAADDRVGLNARSAMLEDFRNKELPSVMIPADKLKSVGNETLNQLCKASAALEWRNEFAALADEVLRRVGESSTTESSSSAGPMTGNKEDDGSAEGMTVGSSSSIVAAGGGEPLNLYSIVYQMQLLGEDEEDARMMATAEEETARKAKDDFFNKVLGVLEASAAKFDSSILAHIAAAASDAKVRPKCFEILSQRAETQKELDLKPKLAFSMFIHALPSRPSSIEAASEKEKSLVNKMIDVMASSHFDKVFVPSPVLIKDLVQLRKLRTYGYVNLPKDKETKLVEVLSEEIVQRADTIAADELVTVAAVLDSFGYPQTKRYTEDLLRRVWQGKKDLGVGKRFELLRLVEDSDARLALVDAIVGGTEQWISEEDMARIVRSLLRTHGTVPRMGELVDWTSRMASKLAGNAELDVLIRTAKLISLHHVKTHVLGLNSAAARGNDEAKQMNRATDSQLQFFEILAEQIVTRKDLSFSSSSTASEDEASSSTALELWIDLLSSMARIRFVARPDALGKAVEQTVAAFSAFPVQSRSILSLSEVLTQSDVVSAAMASSPLFASIQKLAEAVRSQVQANSGSFAPEDLAVVSKFLDVYMDPTKKGPAGWL